ncbi:MAG: hypothetical protein NTY77_16705 [Elusimicrobia bacterium]|nr:hypothetical protein [Elusimicrobiota bacterium]
MGNSTIEAPGWKHALRLWWSFTWRWPLVMLVPLVPVAILVAVFKPEQATALFLARAVAWPLAFGAQIWVFRQLLRVDYKDFSVRAVERVPLRDSGSPPNGTGGPP